MKNFFWLCVGLVAGYKVHEWVNSETGKSAEESSTDMLNEAERKIADLKKKSETSALPVVGGHLLCQAIG